MPAFPVINRSLPLPNDGPEQESEHAAYFFCSVISGIVVGPSPCGLTMLNRNALLHFIHAKPSVGKMISHINIQRNFNMNNAPFLHRLNYFARVSL